MSDQSVFPRLFNVLAVLPALAVAACDPMSAQPTVPARPVLVTNAHYELQISERGFVGTIRPRIESDLGFRVAGKVSKRLVEVGTLVEAGQPLALSTRSISSCRPSRPPRNLARRLAYWRRQAPQKRAPKSCGRKAGRQTRNWTRLKRPPMKRAPDSTAQSDRSN